MKKFAPVFIVIAFFAALILVQEFNTLKSSGARMSEAEQIDLVFEQAFGPEAQALLKSEFSEDYNTLVENTAALLAENKNAPEAAFAEGQAFAQRLATRYGADALRAPIADLRAHLQVYKKVVDGVSDQPDFCGRLAYYGAAAISADDLNAIDPQAFIPQFQHRLTLMAKGKQAQETHVDAGPTDVAQSFADWYEASTLDADTLAVFEAENWQDPRFCSAWADYIAYVAAREDALGDRVTVFWARTILAVPPEA